MPFIQKNSVQESMEMVGDTSRLELFSTEELTIEIRRARPKVRQSGKSDSAGVTAKPKVRQSGKSDSAGDTAKPKVRQSGKSDSVGVTGRPR